MNTTKDDEDKAFQQMLNLRNDIYFNHYYTRLQEALPQNQGAVASQLLGQLAGQEALSAQEAQAIGASLSAKEMESLLESLQYDGYIFFDSTQKSYRFQSALLREWWHKKMPGL